MIGFRFVSLSFFLTFSNAFVLPALKSPTVTTSVKPSLFASQPETTSIDEAQVVVVDEASTKKNHLGIVPVMAASAWATMAQASYAAGPDWGLFEGRTGSLIHPVVMGGLFAYTVYTAVLGFQWRRQRTIGEEINALKKSMPDLMGESTVEGALTAAKAASPVDTQLVNVLTQALPADLQIRELQDERKRLAEAGSRDRHFAQGALLAFMGTAFAIEACLNTYARAGKLFPGPHLYAGAGLVVAWALASACVPAMQKGNDLARNVHIGSNLFGILLFAWQVQSGIPILLKVIDVTRWP